jgi:putative redox protein
MIGMYAATKGWDPPDVIVDVEYDTETTPRLVSVRIVVPPDLSPDQTERLLRVARTCPVRRTLEAGFRFEERVELAPKPERRHAA